MIGIACLFFGLAYWQLLRGQEKDLRLSQFSGSSELSYLPAANPAEFTRVNLKGRFRQNRNVLADNQVLNGRQGVHVYSVFDLAQGNSILVNRGWLPLAADRSLLPEVETPTAEVEIYGHIGPIPVPGRQLGAEDILTTDQWPKLLTYPRIESISAAMNEELYPMVLFLDENVAAGFEGRQWKPVYMSPAKHRAYAFQWFALAVTAIAGWIVLGVKRGKTS